MSNWKLMFTTGIIALSTQAEIAQAQVQSEEPIVCPRDEAREENAWYVGPYRGPDNYLSGRDLAQDALCSHQFKRERYPNGFVTIYGSSRISEFFELPKPKGSTFSPLHLTTTVEQERAFNVTYAAIRTFAHDWTTKYRAQYPILTGAGPGLMEAGSRGAYEAGGSVGYTTYYAKASTCNPHCYTDDPQFWQYTDPGTNKKQRITSDGLVFSSVSMRETSMILHSAAIVIAPGGTGTEWEIYQILEMVKSKQLKPVPIFFVGPRAHWLSLEMRLKDMVARGTIKEGEVPIEFAQCPDDLVNRLSFGLGLSSVRPPLAEEACAVRSPYEIKALKELGFSAAEL